MINKELRLGMRVESGEAEDYEAGRIVSSRLGWSSGYTWWLVQWDSGERTECLATQLRAEFSGCHTDGCNHGDCEAAARDEAKRFEAECDEYNRREGEWRGEE
jgi:hypothetical protein